MTAPAIGPAPAIACDWARVLVRLEQTVGEPSVSLWLRNTVLRSFTPASAEIGVPNLFVATWIEQRLAEPVADAIAAETGCRPRLRFTIDAALFRERRAAQAGVARATELPRAAGAPRPLVGPAAPPPGTNPEFRLDSFVVGPGNRMAHGAATSVAERPGALYNPLFLFGGSGLGKTHLLQGIAASLHDRGLGSRVCYVPAETFVNQFLAALQRKAMGEFRERFRRFDVLILDDVHMLAGKEATQDEFLHTFNAMATGGRQLVLASDSAPNAIARLRQDLANRFVSGLVVRVESPDLETRCRILTAKAAARGCRLGADVAEPLAQATRGSVRELEGVLTRLLAHARLLGEPLSPGLAHRVAAEGLPGRRPIGLPEIAAEVAAAYGVATSELHARRRTRRVTIPRHVAMWLARRLTPLSLTEIGEYFGQRNHVSVLNGEQQVARRCAADAGFRRGVEALAVRLRPDGA